MSKVTQLVRAGAQVKAQVCPIRHLCSWPLRTPYQAEVRGSPSPINRAPQLRPEGSCQPAGMGSSIPLLGQVGL